MESSISVPIFTDEDEQRLATYLLLNAGAANEAAPVDTRQAVERATKACATLEGIQLLVNIAERFHQQSAQLTQNIAVNIDSILKLCSHLKHDGYFGSLDTFLDELRYRVHFIIHEPKDILKSDPSSDTEENSLLRLSHHLKNEFASKRGSITPSNVVTNEIASILEKFHLDQTNEEDYLTCIRYARTIDSELQEQCRLQLALNVITTALDGHAVKLIFEMTNAAGADETATLEKLDLTLQKFGAYRAGRVILASLIASANDLKAKSHDQLASRIIDEISAICVVHLPDIFENKINQTLQQYNNWANSTSEDAQQIKVYLKALSLLKYTITNDFAKMALLSATRDLLPRAMQPYFSGRFLAFLRKYSLNKINKSAYEQCALLAKELDACVFMTAKLIHLRKSAAFWLDYHYEGYNKIINEMLEHIDNESFVIEKMTNFLYLFGIHAGKSILDIIEYNLSHGINKLHHDNMQKSHKVYQSHDNLALTGSISMRNKSSRLLTLGKFASKNVDDVQEHALSILQIRHYEKLRGLLVKAIGTVEKEPHERMEFSDSHEPVVKMDEPHSNLNEHSDSSQELLDSPFAKHHF